jgi:signal recognition particle subunit SRP54
MRNRPGNWKRDRKNQFDFEDFKQQLDQIRKWAISRSAGNIPGVGKSIKDIDISNDSFKGIEAMISP